MGILHTVACSLSPPHTVTHTTNAHHRYGINTYGEYEASHKAAGTTHNSMTTRVI